MDGSLTPCGKNKEKKCVAKYSRINPIENCR